MINLIPIDVSTFGILGCVIAIALGGFLRGFLGFGAALLMVPILSSILTPAVGLVIMYLVEVPTVLYLMPSALKKGKVKIVLPMILALLVTIPIGFYFVVSLNPETIRIVISVMVILMVALLASGWKPKGEISLFTMIMGGGFSGLVNGAAGVGGPQWTLGGVTMSYYLCWLPPVGHANPKWQFVAMGGSWAQQRCWLPWPLWVVCPRQWVLGGPNGPQGV